MDDPYASPPFPLPSFQNATGQTDNICVFHEEFKFFLLPVCYSAVFILGLPLNLTAMWIFFAKMRPWSSTTVYMFNLALSDTLYLLSLPALIYYYAARNNWPFGEIVCKIMRFLFYTNLYSSILFLTCISIHRYLGVCHPLLSLHRMKVRHAHISCLGVWTAVTVCLIPNLIYVTVSPNGNDTLCHDTTRQQNFEDYVEYSTVVMSLLFGVPCLVIAGCYGLMARELMKPMVSGSRRTLPAYKRKSLKTIVLVLTVFIICFLPFHVTRTIYYYARLLNANCHLLNIVNLSYKVTRPLASANSCFDPALYFLASDNYQKKLLGALRSATNMCRRRLPVIQAATTRNGDGPAVIAIHGNLGSAANLCSNEPGAIHGNLRSNEPGAIHGNLGSNEPGAIHGNFGSNEPGANIPGEIVVERDDNNQRTSAKPATENVKSAAKWRITGTFAGSIGAGVAGDNEGEPRDDEPGNVIAGHKVHTKITRAQSDNVSERKTNKAKGEKRRFWSVRRMRGPQNKGSYEGKGTSCWNLLETACQGGQNADSEEDNSKVKARHFLPNI